MAKANVIYVFPGQGVTEQGMGSEFTGDDASRGILGPLFEQANRVGKDEIPKFSSIEEIFRMPLEEQVLPSRTHMSMFALCLGAVRVFEEAARKGGLSLEMVAASGQSMGMYAALAVAGVLPFDAALNAVARRGAVQDRWREHLRAYVRDNPVSLKAPFGPGKMPRMAAVIGLDEVAIQEVANDAGVYVTNVNGENLINVAGNHIAVTRAMDLAKARGARRVVEVLVGAPFHSPYMLGSGQVYGEFAAEHVAKHAVPAKSTLISDLDGGKLTGPDFVGGMAGVHISTTVRFKDAAHSIADIVAKQGAKVIAFGGGKSATGALANCFRGLLPEGALKQVYSTESAYSAVAQLTA